MKIDVLDHAAAIGALRASLHLNAGGLDAVLVAQALRRAAQFLAPVARHELERSVRVPLHDLGCAEDALKVVVAAVLDDLLAYGDLLEMRDEAQSTIIIRPAPPSFFARTDGGLVLLGVAGDEISAALPEEAGAINYRGALRLIDPQDGADLAALARVAGLQELSETNWLRLPNAQTAQQFLAAWRQVLSEARLSGAITELRILDTATPVTYYRDRWRDPKPSHQGMFVARRPQRYGDPIWCLVELGHGVVQRFVDLFGPGDRERPCDVAWRIQLALDAASDAPQMFRHRQHAAGANIDLFSPLPSWVERKLGATGLKGTAERSLFSYAFIDDGAMEATFLRERVWLQQRQDTQG